MVQLIGWVHCSAIKQPRFIGGTRIIARRASARRVSRHRITRWVGRCVDSTLEEGGVMMAEMCCGCDVASRAAGRWGGADRSSS